MGAPPGYEVEHTIDCDSALGMPAKNWSIHDGDQLPNVVSGTFVWNRAWSRLNVKLLFPRIGKEGFTFVEHPRNCAELVAEGNLPANVLEYLLNNSDLIPMEWQVQEAVLFWGTLYRNNKRRLTVRFLQWTGYGWTWGYYEAASGIYHPALVRAL